MTAMTFDTPLRSRPAPSARPSARPVPRPVARPVAPRTGALRLTRRGRLVVLVVLATLLLVAFSLGRTSADAGATPARPAPTTVVQPGETLWEIARRVAPAADPRSTVARLVQLNDLGSAPIVAGQRLVLPR